MELTAKKITPCLWFDTQAEDAAKFYASVFKNSKIGKISRYGKEGFEVHGKKAGTVMTVEFEIEGQKFLALNGGPHFKFNEAVSFQVHCETQQEIDYFWSSQRTVKKAPAVGSKTSSASRGRSSRRRCPRC
jgi:predicted 3-demethylubiquinone-9 3-methyltransferase (glyoxalase superfamily)